MSGGVLPLRVNPFVSLAGYAASLDVLPLKARAVFGYYAATGEFDYQSFIVKSYVDAEIDRIIASAFTDVEDAIEDEFDVNDVTFSYDTKLILPAELTLGYLYRRVLASAPSDFNPITRTPHAGPFGVFEPIARRLNPDRVSEYRTTHADLISSIDAVTEVTALVVEALLDGDMRDAINDDEYDDFSIRMPDSGSVDIERAATVAQATLQASITTRFEAFPPAVKDAYDDAVAISEAHQTKDSAFRELLDSPDGIREEYKHRSFPDPPELFGPELRNLPYFKTQYDRVGVIYAGMIDMYRAAGFEINDNFKRSIVLAIIGAQIWLDDVDDFYDDTRDGQLTPVTAEYQLAASQKDAYEEIVTITETYLDYAKQYASESGTPMTGIAIEYIYRAGEPSHLPH